MKILSTNRRRYPNLSLFFIVDILFIFTVGLYTQTFHHAGNCFGIRSVSGLTAVHSGIPNWTAGSCDISLSLPNVKITVEGAYLQNSLGHFHESYCQLFT